MLKKKGHIKHRLKQRKKTIMREEHISVNWFLQPVKAFLTKKSDPSGYISAQNNRNWSNINPRKTFDNQKICV
jgi:hypothetical protein